MNPHPTIGQLVRLVLALAVSDIAFRYCIHPYLMYRLKKIRGEEPDKKLRTLAPLLGDVERALYIGSMLLHVSGFIGIWLALKATTRLWPEGGPKGRGKVGDYQVWLIGTGISVMLAFLSAWFVLLHLPRLADPAK